MAATTAGGRVGIAQTWRESPTAVKALLVGTFVNRFGGFLQIFLVLYLINRGFTATQAGAALGAYGAGSIAGMVVGGWMSDRITPRRTIVISMAVTAALVLAVLFLTNFVVILIAVAVLGAASQAYRPASTSMISQLTPPDRQVMIFAMCRLAINLGTTIAPLLGAVLVAGSYGLLFVIEAVASIVFALIAAIALPGGRTAASEDSGVRHPSYLAVLADRRYLLFLVAMFATSVIYIQFFVTLPLTVRADGLSTLMYGSLVALNGLVVVTCELLVAKVVQRWPARVAVVGGVALTGLGMALYAPSWGLVGFVVATVVWTLGEVVGYPTLFFAYPAQAGPPELRGRYLGASNGVYGLGITLGPVVGVAVWNQMGDAMWLWCAVIGMIAALAGWGGVRSLPQKKTAGSPTG
jgi:predicted MFS family arabinose efflux permease